MSSAHSTARSTPPVLPDYAGGCIANVVPSLLGADPAPSWLPEAAATADQVVLLVLDGLGWRQLLDRAGRCPNLEAMDGGTITSVAPSTTSAALTSIATGLAPGAHGITGYRMAVEGQVLNTLTWSTASGGAMGSLEPERIQPNPVFLGAAPPVVNNAMFARGGFTAAHLAGVRYVGYRTVSTLVVEVGAQLRAGEPFVFAYYDGLDKVGHEFGLGEHYDAELVACDRLVGELLGALPPGAALVVTADHGQVHSGADVVEIPDAVTRHVAYQSGEDRFRWLHAKPGHADELAAVAADGLGDSAWVRSRADAIADGWFGPEVGAPAQQRYGDVVLAARGTAAFIDPADPGSVRLVGRHGSLTPEEMLVPLLALAR
ncbi:MAG: PglZ domain-containing protein [Acidimicrobiales bacterium]|nr:PglZ domain-containing protein [Acidimicrobiales bacterium]